MAWEYWHVVCAVLVPGVLWASWIDYSQHRVPNWLNLALIVMGLTAQAWFASGGATPAPATAKPAQPKKDKTT